MLPAVSCLMSMFPPLLRGGAVTCAPGSASATPITPRNGASGIWTPGRKSATCPLSFQSLRYGSVKSSRSSPMPGRNEVYPRSPGTSSRTSTCSTSPGRAPRISTGPVSGWPFDTRLPTSADVIPRR